MDAVNVQQITSNVAAVAAATYPVQVQQSATVNEVDLTSQNIQGVAVVPPIIDGQQNMQTLVTAPMVAQSQNAIQQNVIVQTHHEIPSQFPAQQVCITIFLIF